jgi:predicted permease
MRRGLPAQEAARRARIEFGHVESHRADARASRGLHVLDRIGFSWLDLKLGVRMLAKYPGLSLVSVFGMSVAIAIGAGGFSLIYALVDAPLPLHEGERIVSLQNSDARNPGSPDRHALHDFLVWRDEVRSVRDLSAFVDDDVVLDIPGGGTDPVDIARMSASGFRVARVAPALGRPLLDGDERAGAPPVVVIGQEEWQRRFHGDTAIIGSQVRIDDVVHTVVGVMPAAFRFPIDHRYWVPLRLDPSAYEVGAGPEIRMFARLADGATIEQAQAELTTVGRRMAAAYPDTHLHLRPWIRPYTHPFMGIDSPARALLVRSLQLGLSLLLVVVSVNVAILVYARTAARAGEIAVRTALGASRRRVVTQLFAEALVLSGAAAVVGITIAAVGFDLIRDLLIGGGEDMPFWVDFSLSPALVAYAAVLAVLAAAIVGAVPALKATGRAVQGNLQQLSSRGSQMRLGRTWTALIVFQVAVSVAVLPYSLWGGSRSVSSATAEPDFPIDEFLHATLSVEPNEASASPDAPAREDANTARFAGSVSALIPRIAADPAVADVTFASRFPGREQAALWEVEGAGTRSWTWVNDVDVGLFDAFGIPILAGRGFVEADAVRGSNAVIVDQVFAEHVLGGGNVLGHRMRERAWQEGSGEGDPGPWLEIVGVVPAFTPPPPFQSIAPKLYRPLAVAQVAGSVSLVVRMRPGTSPATFLGRVREVSHAVDPALRLGQLQTAAEAERLLRSGYLSLALAIVAITGSVLLLSAAGIYAMMSFTVASRRREIGIRSALGAAPRRVLTGIFKRAAAQLGTGVVIGLLLAEAVPRIGGGSFFAGEGMLTLLPVLAIVLAIGLLAALGPARRGLAIQPTEALREE